MHNSNDFISIYEKVRNKSGKVKVFIYLARMFIFIGFFKLVYFCIVNLENLQDLDEETLGRIDFQNQVQTLMEELEFLRRVHEQEVKELQALLAQAPADTREFFKNELALAIRDIKDEYDYIAKQGKQDMESWYKLKVLFL